LIIFRCLSPALDSPGTERYDIDLEEYSGTARRQLKVPPLLLLGTVVLLLVAGQSLAKYGATLTAAGRDGRIPYLLAYGCYLLRGVSWIAALRVLPVSLAYPALASAYPLILLVSAHVYGEAVSALRISSSVLIGLGVLLLGLGEKKDG
jgi:small multidrug resistance pump